MALFYLFGSTWYEFKSPTAAGYVYPPAKTESLGYSIGAVEAAIVANEGGAFSNIKKQGSNYTFDFRQEKYLTNPKDPHASINTQAGGGNDFGYGGIWPCSGLYVTLASYNLEPTPENMLNGFMINRTTASAVAVSRNHIIEVEKEIRNGTYSKPSAAELNDLIKNGWKKKSKSKASDVFGAPRFKIVDKNSAEKEAKTYDKNQEIQDEHLEKIRDENISLIENGIKQGEIVFPKKDAATGRIIIPDIVRYALAMRGINADTLPERAVLKVGFAWGRDQIQGTEGIKLKKNDGGEYGRELKGLVFRLDEGGYQIRCMDGYRGGTKNPLHFVSKDEAKSFGRMRFMTVGQASPCGFKETLQEGGSKPLIIVEGVIDKISIDNVAHGRFNVVALQGAGNRKYILEEAEKLKAQGKPVIVALDGDEAGESCADSLINGEVNKDTGVRQQKGLKDYGVKTFNWPGCLTKETADGRYINKDINELLQNDRASAERLIRVLSYIIETTQSKKWNLISGRCSTQEEMGQKLMDMLKAFTEYSEADKVADSLKEFETLVEKKETWTLNMRKEKAAGINFGTLVEASREAVVVVPEKEEDSDVATVHDTPVNITNALKLKGIPVRMLPGEIIDKISFIEGQGVRFTDSRTLERDSSPSYGLMFDSIYGETGDYCMQLYKMERKPQNHDLVYVFKDEGMYDIGSFSNPFGLDYAESSLKDTPVFITDSIFDALSIMAVSRRNATAVSVPDADACFLQMEAFGKKVKEEGGTVIFAMEPKVMKAEKFDRLAWAMKKSGCDVAVWPWHTGYRTFNELVQTDNLCGEENRQERKAEGYLLKIFRNLSNNQEKEVTKDEKSRTKV